MAEKKKVAKKAATKTVAKKKVAKKAARKTAAKKAAGSCFTIMPFGGWFDDYYERIYQAAIEAGGLTPKRADDLYRPSTVVNDIWQMTQEARIILADLTGKNPNVFYELGLAHALAKPAILVTESMDDIPFDLRSLRVLSYDKNQPDWGIKLQEDITQAIEEILQSPLESVLPAFLSTKAGAKPKALPEQEKILMVFRQELDSLRREVSTYRHQSARELDPREAEQLLDRYVKRGYPPHLIISRLTMRGAPEGWVRRKLQEEDPQLRFPSFD